MDTETDEKVKRWKMAIQEFDCEVEHIPGKDNIVADGFSRLLPLEEDLVATLVEENFYAFYDMTIPVQQYDDIAKCHNHVAGHHGVERTLEKLNKLNLHWLYRREHVKKFLRDCPYCQKMSYVKTPVHTHPFTVACYHPMERLGIDSIGPLPDSESGYKHIVVIICCFTRWVELFPLVDLTKETFAKVLMQHFGRFGSPAQIIHANGPQFKNGLIEEIIALTGTQNIPALPYSSEENGIVERANKEVMRHLRAIIFEKNILSNWEDHLPQVQRMINATRNEANAVGADQLLFGNAIKLDRGIFLPPDAANDVNGALSQWAAEMLKSQEDIMRIAQRTQRERDTDHLVRSSPKRTEYPVGSYVLVDYHKNAFRKGPPNKMLTYLRGPMRVKSIDKNTYILLNLVTRKDETIHVTDLRPFNYDPNHVDPVDVARKDITSTFVVERIIEHVGDEKRKSSLDFRVRWQGYDEEHDLWLPYAEVRDVEATHIYLRDKGLHNLIPAKFNEPGVRPTLRQRRGRN